MADKLAKKTQNWRNVIERFASSWDISSEPLKKMFSIITEMLLIHRSSNLLIYFHFLTKIMVLVIYKHLISTGGNTLNLSTAGGFQMTVVSFQLIFELNYLFNPSCLNPKRSEKINLIFYFYTSLRCLKRFDEGLHKTFVTPQRSVKIKI